MKGQDRQKDTDTFYITTPIFYPNGAPHMGHAYTVTISDIMARYHRMHGADTYFLTGTDENTGKIVEAANAAGKDTNEFVDGIVRQFKDFFSLLNASYDQFIRTSDKERHWPGVVELWKRLKKSGDIYKGKYTGLYCEGSEAFVTEKDLIDGKCPDHDEYPKVLEEENYFFKLSQYTDAVKEKIKSGELNVFPRSRKNEILSLLDEGLQDISFSRPVKAIPWGIPVPGDPSQNIYVWCDALTNYISALGFGAQDDAKYKKFWPVDYHVIGKDILRFHAAIWPAMLLSAGVPLPKNILVHGMILSGGRKMSKTLGNILNPRDFIDEYGVDALRYYLAREVSPFEDGDITPEKFKEAYNANLAKGLGNVVSRILKMAIEYDVPFEELMLSNAQTLLENDEFSEYKNAFENFEINKAADFVWSLIAFMDSYIEETKPFKTVKEDSDKASRDVLFLVERLWEVAVLLEPFMPETAETIQAAIKEREMPEPLFMRK